MAVIYVPRKPTLAILVAPEFHGRLWKDLDDVQPVADKEGFDSSLAIQIPDGIRKDPNTFVAGLRNVLSGFDWMHGRFANAR
jgi:hypothetical protein